MEINTDGNRYHVLYLKFTMFACYNYVVYFYKVVVLCVLNMFKGPVFACDYKKVFDRE